MDIIISNSSGKPIYEQISSQVRAQILSGALEAGERLPSIRALADGLGVSVITTKRVLSRRYRARAALFPSRTKLCFANVACVALKTLWGRPLWKR